MSGTSAPELMQQGAGVFLELAGQVRELPPPAGYDAALFAREMEELSAEIAGMVANPPSQATTI